MNQILQRIGWWLMLILTTVCALLAWLFTTIRSFFESKLDRIAGRRLGDVFQNYDTIYFGGASWACATYIGALKAIYDYHSQLRFGRGGVLIGAADGDPPDMFQMLGISRIGGHSAGALIGAMVCLGLSPQQIEEQYMRMTRLGRTEGVWGGKMTTYQHDVLNELLVDPTAYRRCNGRLQIGMTLLDPLWLDPNNSKQIIVEHWNSNDELRRCLMCSFNVPAYCVQDARWTSEGREYIAIDGGIGFDASVLPRRTLTIGLVDAYDLHFEVETCDLVYPSTDDAKHQHLTGIGYDRMTAFLKSEPFDPKPKMPLHCPMFVWYMLHRLFSVPDVPDQ